MFKNLPKKNDDGIGIFERINPQNKFRKMIESQNIRNVHKNALAELSTKVPELKPIHLRIWNEERKELEKYLDEHEAMTVFDDETFGALMINFPEEGYEDKAREALAKAQDVYIKSEYEIDDDKDPITYHYLNNITSIDDIYKYLAEKIMKLPTPFKLVFDLSGVFEVHNANGVTYEVRDIYRKGSSKYKVNANIPILIQHPSDIEIVKRYIETILQNYHTSESPTKLLFVTNVLFKECKLVKTTGKIEGLPKEFEQSKWIITDNVDDNLCWYRFLAVCLNEKLAETRTFKINDRTSAAQRLLCDERGCSYSRNRPALANKILSEFNGVSI